MLRDDDGFGADTIEQGQALLPELGGRDTLHEKHYTIPEKTYLDRKS